MPLLRYASASDATLITMQRHKMFADNGFASEESLSAVDVKFEPWVRERLLNGLYIGLLLEEDGIAVAGAGIFFADFPPHWMDSQPFRAYILNVYTEPGCRGKGYAKWLMESVLKECMQRKVGTVVLHAFPFGGPIYKKIGFRATDEMMLRLDIPPE